MTDLLERQAEVVLAVRKMLHKQLGVSPIRLSMTIDFDANVQTVETWGQGRPLIFKGGPVLHMKFAATFLVETNEVAERIRAAAFFDAPYRHPAEEANHKYRSVLHFTRADVDMPWNGRAFGKLPRFEIEGVVHTEHLEPV